jgi:hypothetical protein
VNSAWLHFERVGRISILHVSGDIDRAISEKFARAVREAACGPADCVLTVSFLECHHIDYACLLTMTRLFELAQRPVHVIAAPDTEARRMFDRPEFSVLPVHDGFREAFLSIAAPSSSRQTHRRTACNSEPGRAG